MTIKEKYRAPSYAPEAVASRHVRRVCDDQGNLTIMYRVYECAKGKRNVIRGLAKAGAGPTIREYDCRSDQLPSWLAERIGASRAFWKWM